MLFLGLKKSQVITDIIIEQLAECTDAKFE